MYKKLRIILSISIALLIISCSKGLNHTIKEVDGVKYYFNKQEPSQVINFNPVKLFEIDGTGSELADSLQGFGTITQIVTDLNNNVYILDQQKATIKEYNSKGEFDKFIGVKGKGIRQLFKPSEMALMYDTLVVYDINPRRYIRFLTNGSHLTSQILMATNTPQFLTSDGNSTLVSFQFVRTKPKNVRFMNNDLCLLSDRFKVKKVIKEIRYALDSPDFFFPNMFTTYFQKDGLFYIPNNESDKYSIEVINTRGNLKYVIEKEFDKLPYNSTEFAQLDQFMSQSGGWNLDSTKTYYKKAVNMIFVDKYDRIWTLPSVLRTKENETTHYIDLFKDGVFLDRIALDIVGINESFILSGDRIYVMNYLEKKIKVYEY